MVRFPLSLSYHFPHLPLLSPGVTDALYFAIGRGGLGALLLGEKPKMYEVALVDEKWVEEDKAERQDSEGESEEGDVGLKKEKAMGLWGDITVRFEF